MDAYKKIINAQKQRLAEAKQVGIIYHFTSMSNAWGILHNGNLKPKGNGQFYFDGNHFVNDRARDWVSFTRNKNLKITPGAGGGAHVGEVWNEVRLAFDGDKLSNRHRIEPFHDDDGSLQRTDNQAEEKIKGNVTIMGSIVGVTFYYDVYMRNQTDYEDWASVPDKETQERYTKQARQDAADFVKSCKAQGYAVAIERGYPVTALRRTRI